ncbi:uroporphyrinogen-III synthase [Paenibacillus yanchengensis]|uniref:Uroporphyrinogen-III synthase n=1 Tax=Paenibacillus yanchengensis TaxID=2035833 RepID=A0ABW4YL75_9BACL
MNESLFVERPLAGKGIVVTRARAQASTFIEQLESLGAKVFPLPVIAVRKTVDQHVIAEIKTALQSASSYDWLIFTSVNGVHFFMEWLAEYEIGLDTFARAQIAAVGPKTAEQLEKYQLQVERLPKRYDAEGLLELLDPYIAPGAKVLLARGNLARAVLPSTLLAKGISATEIHVYETIAETTEITTFLDKMNCNEVDIVTFASSSAVHHFMAALQRFSIVSLPELLQSMVLASIGPLTSETIRSYGLVVHIEAAQATMDHLLYDIMEYVKERRK